MIADDRSFLFALETSLTAVELGESSSDERIYFIVANERSVGEGGDDRRVIVFEVPERRARNEDEGAISAFEEGLCDPSRAAPQAVKSEHAQQNTRRYDDREGTWTS